MPFWECEKRVKKPSPVETSRVIGKAIDQAQEARVMLARLLALYGHTDEIPYPDIATKHKAHEFINLPVDKMQAEKDIFMKTVVPQWLEEAAKREAGYSSPVE